MDFFRFFERRTENFLNPFQQLCVKRCLAVNNVKNVEENPC